MLATKSSVSFMKAARSASSNGKMTGSGVDVSTLRRCSHCPAKFEMSASDRSSASMRRTCCCSTTGSFSRPSRPDRAADRPECCSRGKTTGATQARHPKRDRPCRAHSAPDLFRCGRGSRARRAALRGRAECRCRSPPSGAALFVKREERLDVGRRHRAGETRGARAWSESSARRRPLLSRSWVRT